MAQSPAMNIQEVARYWGQFSKSFGHHGDALRTMGFALLQQSLAFRAHRVLEVGCGGGENAQQFAFLARPDAELVSTDLTEEMVAIARQRITDPRVKFAQANAEVHEVVFALLTLLQKLDFPDNSFDSYVATHVLHLTTDPNSALKEAHRVLKPGGYAALSVWGRQENTQTFTIIGQCLKQLDIPSIAAPRRSNFHLNNPTELRDMALKAGFLQAVTYWTSTPMPVLIPAEEKVEMLLCGPGNEAQLASMTEQQRADLRKAMADYIKADIARGVPLNHEALVLVARK